MLVQTAAGWRAWLCRASDGLVLEVVWSRDWRGWRGPGSERQATRGTTWGPGGVILCTSGHSRHSCHGNKTRHSSSSSSSRSLAPFLSHLGNAPIYILSNVLLHQTPFGLSPRPACVVKRTRPAAADESWGWGAVVTRCDLHPHPSSHSHSHSHFHSGSLIHDPRRISPSAMSCLHRAGCETKHRINFYCTAKLLAAPQIPKPPKTHQRRTSPQLPAHLFQAYKTCAPTRNLLPPYQLLSRNQEVLLMV